MSIDSRLNLPNLSASVDALQRQQLDGFRPSSADAPAFVEAADGATPAALIDDGQLVLAAPAWDADGDGRALGFDGSTTLAALSAQDPEAALGFVDTIVAEL